jgi:hypothetical protein
LAEVEMRKRTGERKKREGTRIRKRVRTWTRGIRGRKYMVKGNGNPREKSTAPTTTTADDHESIYRSISRFADTRESSREA